MKRNSSVEDLVLGVSANNEDELSYSCVNLPSVKYEFYLDEDIRSPRYYRGLVDVLLNVATPADVIVLNINSDGGNLDSAVAIIEALKRTQAETVAVITGRCCSSASLIALSCRNIDVGEFAVLMVHEVTFGAGGSTKDVKGQGEFEHRMIEKLYKNVYKHFLTEKEIEDVLDNRTIWMDAEEILDRLEQMNEMIALGVDKEVKYS